MDALTELRQLLRPATGGVVLISTGAAEQKALQRAIYGVASDDEVAGAFAATLERIADARAVVLSVPSDVGAGFVRGANLAGHAIREQLQAHSAGWREWAEAHRVVDIGDVVVVPQLLSDDMLSAEQLAHSRAALYPTLSGSDRDALPVSPLSIAERALELVFQLNPRVVPFVLGGDHSVAWPVTRALAAARMDRWAIVQIDAHTDLLERRLGVRICFGTWSYHANELLGRGGRLVQLGIRATRHPQLHWETTLGVRQYWAPECRAEPAKTIESVVAHLRATGVDSVYFTNDIDGTDPAFADATGTPEPDGLSPDFVVSLIRRLGAEFRICACDLVEVAPLVARTAGGRERTLETAVRYVRETLSAALG